MRVGLEDDTELSDSFVRHMDTCLGCMACVTACPSGVQYDRLIEATRPQIERLSSRSLNDRLFRRLIFFLFPHPKRLRSVALGLWAYQQLGLQRLARTSGLLNLVPARLRAMEAMTPPYLAHLGVGTVSRTRAGGRSASVPGRARAWLCATRVLRRGQPRDRAGAHGRRV